MTNPKQANAIEEYDVQREAGRLSLEASYKIRTYMELQNLSNSEVARRLSISASRVTKVLDGEANITLHTLAQFGLACNIHWTFEPIQSQANVFWNMDHGAMNLDLVNLSKVSVPVSELLTEWDKSKVPPATRPIHPIAEETGYRPGSPTKNYPLQTRHELLLVA